MGGDKGEMLCGRPISEHKFTPGSIQDFKQISF